MSTCIILCGTSFLFNLEAILEQFVYKFCFLILELLLVDYFLRFQFLKGVSFRDINQESECHALVQCMAFTFFRALNLQNVWSSSSSVFVQLFSPLHNLFQDMSVSNANQTNPLEAIRCEFASPDAPITPKFYRHVTVVKRNCVHHLFKTIKGLRY